MISSAKESAPSQELTLPAGYRLFSFDTIDSTNAEALRRIAEGAQGGDVFWARRQTGGRGRRGRVWQSPPGNLYATFVLEVPLHLPIGQLAFVTALGAGEALKPRLASVGHLQYKWPNDLMLNGRKLGGILIEGADRTADLIAVGLGLNLANCPTGLPAASLSENGIEISVREILEAVCLSVDHWYRLWCREGFAPVRQQWLADAYGLEDTMQVRFPDGSEAAGIFSGIDPNGALLLGQPDGETRCIATGEVFFASA